MPLSSSFHSAASPVSSPVPHRDHCEDAQGNQIHKACSGTREIAESADAATPTSSPLEHPSDSTEPLRKATCRELSQTRLICDMDGALPPCYGEPIVSRKRQRCSSLSFDETAVDTPPSPRCSRGPLLSCAAHTDLHLEHPIVRFLSSVQLQGYAHVIIDGHGMRSMEHFVSCVQTEQQAGEVLGSRASLQQRRELVRGLQRWVRDDAKAKRQIQLMEKRQKHECQRKRKCTATQKLTAKRQVGVSTERVVLMSAGGEASQREQLAYAMAQQTASALARDIFDLNALCDELLADTRHDTINYIPTSTATVGSGPLPQTAQSLQPLDRRYKTESPVFERPSELMRRLAFRGRGECSSLGPESKTLPDDAVQSERSGHDSLGVNGHHCSSLHMVKPGIAATPVDAVDVDAECIDECGSFSGAPHGDCLRDQSQCDSRKGCDRVDRPYGREMGDDTSAESSIRKNSQPCATLTDPDDHDASCPSTQIEVMLQPYLLTDAHTCEAPKDTNTLGTVPRYPGIATIACGQPLVSLTLFGTPDSMAGSAFPQESAQAHIGSEACDFSEESTGGSLRTANPDDAVHANADVSRGNGPDSLHAPLPASALQRPDTKITDDARKAPMDNPISSLPDHGDQNVGNGGCSEGVHMNAACAAASAMRLREQLQTDIAHLLSAYNSSLMMLQLSQQEASGSAGTETNMHHWQPLQAHLLPLSVIPNAVSALVVVSDDRPDEEEGTKLPQIPSVVVGEGGPFASTFIPSVSPLTNSDRHASACQSASSRASCNSPRPSAAIESLLYHHGEDSTVSLPPIEPAPSGNVEGVSCDSPMDISATALESSFPSHRWFPQRDVADAGETEAFQLGMTPSAQSDDGCPFICSQNISCSSLDGRVFECGPTESAERVPNRRNDKEQCLPAFPQTHLSTTTYEAGMKCHPAFYSSEAKRTTCVSSPIPSVSTPPLTRPQDNVIDVDSLYSTSDTQSEQAVDMNGSNRVSQSQGDSRAVYSTTPRHLPSLTLERDVLGLPAVPLVHTVDFPPRDASYTPPPWGRENESTHCVESTAWPVEMLVKLSAAVVGAMSLVDLRAYCVALGLKVPRLPDKEMRFTSPFHPSGHHSPPGSPRQYPVCADVNANPPLHMHFSQMTEKTDNALADPDGWFKCFGLEAVDESPRGLQDDAESSESVPHRLPCSVHHEPVYPALPDTPVERSVDGESLFGATHHDDAVATQLILSQLDLCIDEGPGSPLGAPSLSASHNEGEGTRLRAPTLEEMATLEAEYLREQLLLASARARFMHVVCPTFVHRVSRLSGLPYRRVRAADLVDQRSMLTQRDLEAARQAAKEEEHKEVYRCVMASLAVDTIEQVEARSIGAQPYSPLKQQMSDELTMFERLLLLESTDVDAAVQIIQRDFPHVSRNRVQQLLTDSGIPLSCVQRSYLMSQEDTNLTPVPLRTNESTGINVLLPSPHSPPGSVADQGHSQSSLAPSASPEVRRRTTARRYFAQRGAYGRGRGLRTRVRGRH